MGDARYPFDEEKFGDPNGGDLGDSGADGRDRHDALAGYKKLAIILLAFSLVLGFRANVLGRVIVSGDSMNPSFSDGDVMWARKFDVDELTRHQVVVADIDGKDVIKRVIGLPNETVEIIDGFVHINGEKLTGDHGDRTTFSGVAGEKIELADNEYFLMGDNRDDSTDSRVWGAVRIDDIEGVVIFRFFPFWKIGLIDR